jgi:hypothetical protein
MAHAKASTPRDGKIMKLYLLVFALGLVPIALSYGVAPARILPHYLDITVRGTDQTQIFRAMMCLYLGVSLFFVMGAVRSAWRRPAVAFAAIFALSLALGRVISLVVDGPASRLLDIYLGLEIIFGALGLYLLARDRRNEP